MHSSNHMQRRWQQIFGSDACLLSKSDAGNCSHQSAHALQQQPQFGSTTSLNSLKLLGQQINTHAAV
jgi:hypothetical protein